MSARVIASVLVSLLLGACGSGITVWAGSAPGANPPAYGTFAPIDPVAPPGTNSIVFESMRQVVERSLTSKGYATAYPADLEVLLTLSSKDRLSVYSWERLCWNWDCWPGVDVRQHTEALVAVDLIDSRTGQALWRGQASLPVDPGVPDVRLFEEAVTRFMAKLPPNDPAASGGRPSRTPRPPPGALPPRQALAKSPAEIASDARANSAVVK